MLSCPPPPQGIGSLTDMWGTPPLTFLKFFAALFVFSSGYAMPPDLFAIFFAPLFVFYSGYAWALDLLHCFLSVSRNDNQWIGCVVPHEHHPVLAL